MEFPFVWVCVKDKTGQDKPRNDKTRKVNARKGKTRKPRQDKTRKQDPSRQEEESPATSISGRHRHRVGLWGHLLNVMSAIGFTPNGKTRYLSRGGEVGLAFIHIPLGVWDGGPKAAPRALGEFHEPLAWPFPGCHRGHVSILSLFRIV